MSGLAVLVAAETAVLAVLSFLVVGLLRTHGDVLRRLHALDGGAVAPAHGPPAPALATGGPAADLAGVDAQGDGVALRVGAVEVDTLLAFLSSTCATCAPFWQAVRSPEGLHLPEGVRLVVVTRDAGDEDAVALDSLTAGVPSVVLSSSAWSDYQVPGSPYFVLVDGRDGVVRGEGTGTTWGQVLSLIQRARAASASAPARRRWLDRDEPARIDAELLAAGINPGDPSLHGAEAS